MIDVRSSHRKNLRTHSATKGFHSKEMKQDRYLTWSRWAFDNRGKMSEAQFMVIFHQEWDRVEKYNMEKYGRPDPWLKPGNRYILRPELQK